MVKFISTLSVLLILVGTASYAARDEATVKAIWNFDEGDAADSSGNDVNGTFIGEPEVVDGIIGKALQFDGIDDGVKFPNEDGLNAGGPWTDRTIAAYFKCSDVSIVDHKQTIFEEGGTTRGFVIYVFDGKVHVGAWNRAEYNWPGAWPAAEIESDRWYHVALVLRDSTNAVEDDRFEMWLDGKMVASEPGGQLHGHTAGIGIAHINGDSFFHDGGAQGNNIHFFGGTVDETVVYNSAFDVGDFEEYADTIQAFTSVEPQDKFTTTWGTLKSQRISR